MLADFYCYNCKKTTERIVKQGVDELVCSSCGAISYRQKITRASFHLKGSGWFKPGPSMSDMIKPQHYTEVDEADARGDII